MPSQPIPTPWSLLALLRALACLPRAITASAGAIVVALVAACGPGVGGTGSGEDALAAFGASAASACTSPFANRLDCPAGPAAQIGTALRYAADGEPASRHLARFEGNAASFDARCAGLRFDGSWGVSSSLGARYYGFAEGGGMRQLATLAVQADGSGGLVLTLFATDARVLAGPVTLRAVSAQTAPAACP